MIWIKGLDNRSLNCIKHLLAGLSIKTKEELRTRVEAHPGKLKRTKGVGRITYRNILAWLGLPAHHEAIWSAIQLLERNGYRVEKL